MNRNDKYEAAKEEIIAIYHENKGRYGYRRITMELRNPLFEFPELKLMIDIIHASRFVSEKKAASFISR